MGVVDLFNQIADNDFGFFRQVDVVSDIMTAAPQCLSLDDTFESATEFFRRGGFHHAPVLNADDQSIVGIVSDRDLLRHCPPLLGKAAESDDDRKTLQDGVARFMTRNPVWCTADSSPVGAITLMLGNHIDSVLVSPDGCTLQGIVTPRNFIQTMLLYHRVCTRDFDLRRLRLVDLDLSRGIPLDEIFSRGAQTVRDVMTRDVESVGRDDPLSLAISRMRDREIRHLPVLNSQARLVGMLSDREILKQLPVPQRRLEEPGVQFRDVLFDTDDKAALLCPVHSVMNDDVRAVNPDMLLSDAMKVLNDHTVSGFPVVDSNSGQLCGIITTSDILRVFRVVMQIGSLSETKPTVAERERAVANAI